MAIAHLIREARERAGFTRVELARRAGVAASTVGRIEAGTRVPSTDLAERLVRAAGFEIRVALGEPDPATDALFERTLRRTPAERLADATRAARFVLRGRRAMTQRKSPTGKRIEWRCRACAGCATGWAASRRGRSSADLRVGVVTLVR